MPPGPRITVRLTPALEALVSDCVRQGTSVSALVREALEAYLERRQTPATAVADTMADTVSDTRPLAIADVSDIRARLAHLEQRVAALSDTVRQSRTLSDTPAILDMPRAPISDTVSDECQTQAESVSSTERPMLSDTHEARPAALSDTDVPPFDTRKFVLGKLCPRGHEYDGTGQTLRRVRRHVCPACDVERTRALRKARREAAS
jgi:Arc/MetJ-type ribon-helix-helix transcriptional regulator